MRQSIDLIGDVFAKREELLNETVERNPVSRGSRKQRRCAMLQIILDILKVIAKLQQHAPLKGKPRFLIAEKTVRETRVCQH